MYSKQCNPLGPDARTSWSARHHFRTCTRCGEQHTVAFLGPRNHLACGRGGLAHESQAQLHFPARSHASPEHSGSRTRLLHAYVPRQSHRPQRNEPHPVSPGARRARAEETLAVDPSPPPGRVRHSLTLDARLVSNIRQFCLNCHQEPSPPLM